VQADQTVQIHQVSNIEHEQVPAINALLDAGTTWDLEQGQKFLADKNNLLLLATLDDLPIGFLTAHRLQRFDTRKAEVLLYEVGVAEQFQRRGVGKALISRLKEWAQQVGADEVWVLTNRSNIAAVALYTSSGAITDNSGDEVLSSLQTGLMTTLLQTHHYWGSVFGLL
jgi:ribosomal protein S18 acetylase RimI-like enzyme